MKNSFNKLIFYSIIILSFAVGAFAQQTERERGIELYKQGKNSEAVAVLEGLSKVKAFKNDAEIWNYLGLAYLELNDVKKGRKTLEKAVKLNPQSSVFRANLGYALLLNNKINNAQTEVNKAIQLDPQNFAAYYIRGTAYLWERKFDEALADSEKTISLNANFSPAYILKSDVLIARFGNRVANGSTPKNEIGFLGQAVQVLEDCLKNCQDNTSRKLQEEKLEAVKVFYEYFNREIPNFSNLNLSTDNTPKDDTITPLKIISKPRASYTDKAREAGITGTIKIAALFAASGQVSHVIVLDPLGYGLDQQAVKAARGIKFEPLLKDGKPVSTVKIVEYSFMIY